MAFIIRPSRAPYTVMYSLGWLATNFLTLTRHLKKKHDILMVRPHRLTKWHHGAGVFEGIHRTPSSRVFIKTGGWFDLVPREAEAYRRFLKFGYRRAPELVAAETSTQPSFLVITKVDGNTLWDFNVDKWAGDASFYSSLLDQMVDIIAALHRAQLVHRDINPSNVLLSIDSGGKPQLKLVDFAFAVSIGDEALPSVSEKGLYHETMERLGAGLNPQPFKWDDAFAARETLLRIIPEKDHKKLDWSPLNEWIGVNVSTKSIEAD